MVFQEPAIIAGPSTSRITEPIPASEIPEKAPSDNSGLSFPTSDSDSDDLFDRKVKNETIKTLDDAIMVFAQSYYVNVVCIQYVHFHFKSGASQADRSIQAELAAKLARRPTLEQVRNPSLDDSSSAERTPTAPVEQQEGIITFSFVSGFCIVCSFCM